MTYEQIIRHFGRPVSAAKALGVSRQQVHKWSKGDIDERWQAWVEVKTAGALKADLSPTSHKPQEVA